MLFFVFGVFVIVQMLVHGQKLAATSSSKNTAKFSLFESELSKLNAVSTKGRGFVGEKIKEPIIVLNFWASWCLPCIKEFKSLNKLILRYPGKIQVIGINNDTEKILTNIAKTETRHKLLFESLADKDGLYAEKFKVTKIPTSIIFYKKKVIAFFEKETNFVSKEVLNIIEKNL